MTPVSVPGPHIVIQSVSAPGHPEVLPWPDLGPEQDSIQELDWQQVPLPELLD